MKIVVYGLGIIGASICAALKRAGHTVYGKNRSREPLDYALAHDIIDGVVKNYAEAEVVFLALPPHVAMRELDYGNFPRGCIVADVCGVKSAIEQCVLKKQRAYRYVGMHPMAGKETNGITSSSANLFRGANLVVTLNRSTDRRAVAIVEALGRDMGFQRVVECSAAAHDRKIALTSQLAHIVSSAYIRSEETPSSLGFTGGSFQDMTRVAHLDEKIWTDLFLLNRDALLCETDGLIARLKEYRNALVQKGEDAMRELLLLGKEAYLDFYQKND